MKHRILAATEASVVTELLNKVLADEFVLYTKTRNFHWNVTGPQFSSLHALFEKQYEELSEVIDEVAERVRAIGGWPAASLSEYLKTARLRESPGDRPDAPGMIERLLSDHESLVAGLRRDCEATAAQNDQGTNDLLIGVLKKHEKMAWMLRATLAAG